MKLKTKILITNIVLTIALSAILFFLSGVIFREKDFTDLYSVSTVFLYAAMIVSTWIAKDKWFAYISMSGLTYAVVAMFINFLLKKDFSISTILIFLMMITLFGAALICTCLKTFEYSNKKE